MPSVGSVLPARRRPVPRLLRDPDFCRLWIGQSTSQFGAQAGLVILPLVAVIALHADAFHLGLLRAVEQAPLLLFSLVIGAWVDRRRTRNAMVLADLGRALVLAAVAIAYLLDALDITVLLGVAFITGFLSVCFDTAYQASLVRLVRRDQLALGNSVLEGSRSAAQLGGPALGGAMVSLFSAPMAVLSSAFFFCVSFSTIRGIRRSEELPQPADRPRMRTQIHEGLRLVARDSSLRTIGLSSAAFQFSFAALMTVYLVFLPRALHLSGGEIGLVLAAMGPGALAGSLLAASLPRRFGYGAVLVFAATVGDGIMLCTPGLRGSGVVTVLLLMAINFGFGVFGQLVDVTVMAVRQAITPVQLQGRVVATMNFLGMGLTPVGSLLGGFLAGHWGLRTSLLAAGLGMMLSPLLMVLSPLCRLGRELPDAKSLDGQAEFRDAGHSEVV